MLAEEPLLRLLGDRLKYVSLAVVMSLILLSIVASLLSNRQDRKGEKGSST
jgi:hypothetical protein